MTVNELIERLSRLPENERDLEVRVWLPGSHITLDGLPFGFNKGPDGSFLSKRVVLIEGNVLPGSALART